MPRRTAPQLPGNKTHRPTQPKPAPKPFNVNRALFARPVWFDENIDRMATVGTSSQRIEMRRRLLG